MLQMLQSERPGAPLENKLVGDRSDQAGLGDLVNFTLGLLRRQYALILFVTAFAVMISLIYLRVTPPTYTGQVKVLFENPKAQFVRQQSVLAEMPIDNAQLETHGTSAGGSAVHRRMFRLGSRTCRWMASLLLLTTDCRLSGLATAM
jgi:hypothetical protein